MTKGRPVVAVVYDKGAVAAGDIAVGLRDLADIVFVVAPTDHVTRLGEVLGTLGAVLPLTGDPVADAAALRAHEPSALVTFSEPMLRTAARLAADLALPFHDEDTARLLTDKVRQRRRLREAGVDEVRSEPLRGPRDWPAAVAKVGLPAIVKPVRGEGSRNTHAVHDAGTAPALLAELFAAVRASPGREALFVVEELLVGRPGLASGDYVSVESLCGPDGVVHLALTGKFPLVDPFREPGQYWPAQVLDAERREILDLTTRALMALGVRTGLTHTEIKLTPSGPRIIEVNGRVGGHINELSRRACGVDLVRLAGRQALGEDVEAGELLPERVHFQHHGLAPVTPCRFVTVHGRREVRQVDGISGYRTFVRPGDELPGGVMTHEMDILWGACDDHDAMTAVIAKALAVLTYEFEDANGIRRVPAASLLA
ncbi:ATP-grasp domain-containing protein [Streptomyces cyaneus]|uniref:ATP-grasp domain-containing protein n=1 Tax=Streptomyces cyaneus TaxID=1904 RepID=UPI000FF89463|nr:ATP-grasp domain-containing protein [Streptomyces cyaneus]